MMISKILNEWTWQSLDSISVKALLEGKWRVLILLLTEVNKIGTKRHVLTDQRAAIPVSVVVITSANTHDIKAATETLDSVIVERPLKKQNLCLDKGYDYPEIERESIYQKKICATYSSQRCRERIDKAKILFSEEMGCYRKNKFVAQQIQKIIGKVWKEIRKLSCTCIFSLLYYCL